MLNAPVNINGCYNKDVIRRVVSAEDLAQGSRGKWTIDFGLMEQDQAAYYEVPFEYVKRIIFQSAQRTDEHLMQQSGGFMLRQGLACDGL